jgi:hypothetical protein
MSSKMSLLEIVQDILNDLDSDEVNSIDDTIESTQVAQIVKATYQAMMSNRNWPHQKRLLALTPSGDNSLPTHVTMQEEVKEIVQVKYNVAKLTDGARRLYKTINWVEPDDFLRISNQRNTDDPNIDIIVDNNIELLIVNNQAPRYYTSFNDNILIFDAYDNEVDDTIQASKMQVTAYVMLEWVHTDDAIPDLPAEAFTALLEEAKSRCFVKLKQQADPTASTEARRQQAWLARKAWRAAGGVKLPDYGRGSCKTYRDPTFKRDQ